MLANDVYSLVPYDRDGDNIDDRFFLGLGPWQGWCAAAADLGGARELPRLEPIDPQSTDGEPPSHELQVRPLSGSEACTTSLATCDLGAPLGPCLIAGSSGDLCPRTPQNKPGIRVWRLADLGDNPDAEPVAPPLFCDVRAVAGGKMRNQGVFAVACIEQLVGLPGRQNLVFRIYGRDGTEIRLLWESKVFDVPVLLCQLATELHFADLNKDGEQELVANLVDHEVLVFSLLRDE